MPIIHWPILCIDPGVRSQAQWTWLFLLLLNHTTVDAGETQRFTVIGHSMQPTLQPGDQVVVDSECPEQHAIAMNDLVAIQFRRQKTPVVKRVVALPGSQFDIEVNEHNTLLVKQLKRYQSIIPKKHYIVNGDNQTVSQDSNQYGMVSQQQIIGCVTEVLKKP